MKKIKIPFNVNLNNVKNPMQFLEQSSFRKEIRVQNTENEAAISSSEDSQVEMSDKEDSINFFTKRNKSETLVRKRKRKLPLKDECSLEISNLLLKKSVASVENSLKITFGNSTDFKSRESLKNSDSENVDSDASVSQDEVKEHVKRSLCTEVVSDVALRTELIVNSKNDFEWTLEKSSLKECLFIKKFQKRSLENSFDTMENSNSVDAFFTSLMYYVYPANRRAPPYVLELLKSQEKLQKKEGSKRNYSKNVTKSARHESSLSSVELYLNEEVEEWKISFRSAYFMARNGESRFFYYVNSEFSVLFTQRNDQKGFIKAYVSSSTVGLRKALELDGLEFVEKKKSPNQKKVWPLEFEGVGQVHGLYEFLLKWTEPRSDKRSQTLPLLYSETAFLNASLKSSKVIRSSKIQSTNGEGYRLIIKGILFPESVVRILDLLKEKNEEFTVISPAWDITQGLQEARGLETFKSIEFVNGNYYLK